MTGAEFCCGREFLGLPRQWVAAKLGIHVKTVETWERGDNVSDRAQEFMALMLSLAEQAVARMTIKWPQGADIPVPAGRSINGDYPASFHRMIASRVAERTHARIVYKEN